MAFCDLELIDKLDLNGNAKAFYFAKPDNLEYAAGQFGEISFPVPTDGHVEEYVKAFTLASAPFEDSLMIATRIRGSVFKQLLDAVEVGHTVTWEGPFGIFTLDASRPVVFIANGMGITPVRSMLTQANHDSSAQTFQVIYLNTTHQEEVWRPEFEALASSNSNISFISTLNDKGWMHPSQQEYLAQCLQQNSNNLLESNYYLSGGLALVQAARRSLLSLDIPPEQIKTDEFIGY